MHLQVVDLAKRIFKEEVLIKNKGNRVEISYKGKTSQPKSFVFPRKIKIDKNLGEFCGLYYGEGTKAKGSASHQFEFTNSEHALINRFFTLTKMIFGIDKKKFIIRIKARKCNQKNLSDEEVIDFWKKELNLDENTKFRLYWDSGVGKKFGHRAMPYLGSTVLRRIVDEIIEIVCEKCTKQSYLRQGFLRGLFAAEGCVVLKNGSLFAVEIAQGFNDANKDRVFGRPKREFIAGLLHLEKIATNSPRTGIQVIVTNKENLERFHQLKLHEAHPTKYKKFETGLCNLKTSRRSGITNHESEAEVLRILLQKGPLTMQKLYYTRGKCKSTTVDIIKGRNDRGKKGLIAKGYVTVYEKIRMKHSKKISELLTIPNEGKDYLEYLEKRIAGRTYKLGLL